MGEWLAYWWPIIGLALIIGISAWVPGFRRWRMAAATRVCPTCGGVGRIDREAARRLGERGEQ